MGGRRKAIVAEDPTRLKSLGPGFMNLACVCPPTGNLLFPPCSYSYSGACLLPTPSLKVLFGLGEERVILSPQISAQFIHFSLLWFRGSLFKSLPSSSQSGWTPESCAHRLYLPLRSGFQALGVTRSCPSRPPHHPPLRPSPQRSAKSTSPSKANEVSF